MKRSLICVCLLSLMIISGCSPESEQPADETPETSTGAVAVSGEGSSALEEKIKEQKQLIETLEGISKEYLDLLESAVSHLDEENLSVFAKKQFSYTLKINDETVPPEGIVEIDELPIAVTLVSEMGTSILLPQKIYEKGMLSFDDPLEHLNFMKEEPEDVVVRDGTSVQSFTYIFGEESPLEEMEFMISDELKGRLGLDTNVVKIIKGQ